MRTIWTEADLDDICHRLDSGYATVKSIAREKGVDASALYRLLVRRQRTRRRAGSICWPATFHAPENPLLLGYLAGLIDGEGSLIHARLRPRRGALTGAEHRAWRLKITMTDREVIEWLGTLGGNVIADKNDSRTNRKSHWTWSLNRRLDVEMCLAAVFPYLKVPGKRERANHVLHPLVSRMAI